MGTALYVVVEDVTGRDIPAIARVDGKTAAKHMEALDLASKKLSLPPLGSFLSMGGDDAADLLGPRG